MNKIAYMMIKTFEGFNLKAYKDPVGIWTIGYGHTGEEVVEGLTWTASQCDISLRERIMKLESQIVKVLDVILNENQMAALIDFSYNLGFGALKNSTLLKKINAEDKIEDIAEEFLKWNKAGGKVLPGLSRRRQAEHNLYLT